MTNDDTRTQLADALTALAEVADGVTERQLDAPTPCAEFDVRALMGHTVGWLENFAAGFASDDGTCPSADVSGVDVPLDEAKSRVDRAATTLDRALQDGAAERDLTIAGQGGMPGGMALSMTLAEYLVHGWDLATATGQRWSPDEQAVTSSLEFLRGMVTADSRGEGGWFGPEVPVDQDAPVLDRLIGFSGRDPRWSAA